MAPKSSFDIGEKVLCFHGSLLYEAKLLKKEINNKKLRYFVHYSGWKKNWDEWVPESRILKCNDANLQKQRELGKLHIKSKKSAKREVALTKASGKKPEKSSSAQEKSAKKVFKKTPTKKPETPKPKRKPAEKKTESVPKTEQIQLPTTYKLPSRLLESKGEDSLAKCATIKIETVPNTEQIPLPTTYKLPSRLIESKGEDSLAKCATIKIEVENLFEQELPIEKVQQELPIEKVQQELPIEKVQQELPIEIEEEIKIPTPLEDFICEDFDLINNQKMIVRLPARYNVEYILASYVIDKVSANEVPDHEKKRVREFANYIQECFDVLLGKTCLYKCEKPQYLDIHKTESDRRKCEIYGGTHLLRMFCKMDELLKGCNPPGPALTESRKDVKDFIGYLSENMHFFSQRDYEKA